MHASRLTARSAIALLLATTLLPATGCGLSIPTDPDGSLDRVSEGTLRVGLSPDPGLISMAGQSPDGPLIDITEDFAASLDATVVWSIAAEETLVEELETGEIDMAIGGFTDQTPWSDRAGVTRG
ncbi:hypothetical protein [uncultured Microbacterium sp.]|uniref:hypothetical protein n=1 Tax=uncultured Microbacterium sp. TaxID=191216 RepID=UPI00261E613B|nr:hypothetical protein [uncultured Microbacterium sp.]